jgi:hypothetical protein
VNLRELFAFSAEDQRALAFKNSAKLLDLRITSITRFSPLAATIQVKTHTQVEGSANAIVLTLPFLVISST